MKNGIKRAVSVLVAFNMVILSGILFGIEGLSNTTAENNISTYVNEEDGDTKTIYWAKGVVPLRMDSDGGDFNKYITDMGSYKYIEYKAPYTSNKGWYDINKSESREKDANLCFAAAASNALHWWLAQNEDSINTYLEKYPSTPKKAQIQEMLNPLVSQYGSKIYESFVNQFAYRKNGYWSDILIDQFINGYYPKENGGMNDPDFDSQKLFEKGVYKTGGYFFSPFDKNTVTERRYYDQGYNDMNNSLKSIYLNGGIVLLTYDMGYISHVVTVWGVEYNSQGQLSGVYLADSDDEKQFGMIRYGIFNKNGRAVASTRTDGVGSNISSINIVYLKEEMWESAISPLLGDADRNGMVDEADVQLLKRICILKEWSTPYIASACDLNSDGAVDLFDLVELSSLISNKKIRS